MRLERFDKALGIYRERIEKNKPFFSESVYSNLKELFDEVHSEAIGFQYTERKSKEYWIESKENREKILDITDNCCEAIRGRIQSLEAK